MNIPNMNISSKVFNKAYLKLFKDKNPYKVLKGGAGSGKSVFIAQKLVLKTADISQGKRKILVIRKVGKTLKESVFSEIKAQIYKFKIENYSNITRNNIKIFDSEFVFNGLDDPEKIKSISGITDIWIEEATELSIADFLQLEIRLRGKILNPEIWISFNPISKNHWLKKFFFDYSEENKKYRDISTILETTYKDNKFLSDRDRENLEALIFVDEAYYNIYALNKWGEITKGLIYKHFLKVAKIPERASNKYYGLDFGYNHPTALMEINDCEATEFYIKEIFYLTKLTSDDIIENLKANNISKYSEIYADSARPEIIEDIRQAGYNIKEAYKAKNSVIEGINYIKSKKMYSLESNYNFNNELDLYKWKENKGQILDEPVKLNDDTMDSMRYAIYTHNKQTSQVTQIGI